VTDQLSYQIGDRLYLNITDRCTLECRFCPKTQNRPKVRGYDLTLGERPTVEQVIASVGDPARYAEVVFCGFGEPTLRLKVLLEVARWVKSRGGRVRVNTDGLANLVHKDDTLPLLGECVDAISVSMNAQNAAVYEEHCQPARPGSYQKMLDFLRAAPRHIPEVTATAIRGLPGVDIDACERLAEQLGVAFRARELDKVG
jgi:TatD family-associated radical SAM protein